MPRLLPLLVLGGAALAAPGLDLARLATETVDEITVSAVYYTSEVVDGQPVRVFGYLARPTNVTGRIPGVIELHGGGGTANRQSALNTAKLGVCVLNLDWSGKPEKAEHVTQVGALGDPELWNVRGVQADLSDCGADHLTLAIRRGLDLLAAQPEVDPDRLAVMGGSWGGFLSILAAGLDQRVKAAVSGFGCGGFNGTYELCARPLYDLSAAQQKYWFDHVDPLSHAADAVGPVALMTGTNDLHFWLSGAVATFAKLPAGSRLILAPNCVHTGGYGVLWPNAEWLRTQFLGGPAWPEVKDFSFDGRRASWRVADPLKVTDARLYVSPGRDDWPGRIWLPFRAELQGDRYHAELPDWLAGAEADAYPLVIDEQRRSVSVPPLHLAGRPLAEVSAARPEPGLIDDFRAGVDLWRLLFGNHTKARLTWQRDDSALVVAEQQHKAQAIELETNLIQLARAALRPAGVLALRVGGTGLGPELRVTLTSRVCQRDEQSWTVKLPLPAGADWHELAVPLKQFGEVDWGQVEKLAFGWQAAPEAVLRLAEIRVR